MGGRFVRSIFSLAVGSTASAALSGPIAFDFETTPVGFYRSLSVTNEGLTLTVTTEGLALPLGFVWVHDVVPAPLGLRSIGGVKTAHGEVGNWAPTRFTFSTPVDSVMFRFGDEGGDSDSPVLISAYTPDDVLLGTLTESYDPGFAGTKTGTLNYAGASYFITSSGSQIGNENSIFFEVASVSLPASVPEPQALALLFTGLGAMALATRRRRVR